MCPLGMKSTSTCAFGLVLCNHLAGLVFLCGLQRFWPSLCNKTLLCFVGCFPCTFSDFPSSLTFSFSSEQHFTQVNLRFDTLTSEGTFLVTASKSHTRGCAFGRIGALWNGSGCGVPPCCSACWLSPLATPLPTSHAIREGITGAPSAVALYVHVHWHPTRDRGSRIAQVMKNKQLIYFVARVFSLAESCSKFATCGGALLVLNHFNFCLLNKTTELPRLPCTAS